MLSTKFQVNWPFGSGEDKISAMVAILDCRSERFKLFLIYKYPSAPYQVSNQMVFLFRRGGENRFSSWRPWQPFWISDQNVLSYLRSTSPRCLLPSFKSTTFWFRRRSEKQIFKMAATAAILDFQSEKF